MEKLVFNIDPENVPYLSLLRDLQSKDGKMMHKCVVPSSCRFEGDKRVVQSRMPHIF